MTTYRQAVNNRLTLYRIARVSGTGRHVLAQYDFEGATLGEAFEAARVWWHLSSTKDLRCLGVALAPLPQRETVTPQGKRQRAADLGADSTRGRADLVATNWGSLYLLRAQTPEGEDWIDEHLPPRDSADVTIWGDAYAVEPRYLGPIVEGAQADGLEVSHV